MTGRAEESMAAATHPRPLIPVLLAVIVILGIVVPVSGYPVSNRTSERVSDCYTNDLIAACGNVPVFLPNGSVISTGVIEGLPDEKALWDWRYGMDRIVDDTRSAMKEYYFPDGPVISYGYDLLGTICVGIWEEADTDRKTRDDIYAVIDAAARQRGIQSVPVIFIAEPIIDTKPLLWTDQTGTPLTKRLRRIADAYTGSAVVPVFGHHINLALPPEPGFPIHGAG